MVDFKKGDKVVVNNKNTNKTLDTDWIEKDVRGRKFDLTAIHEVSQALHEEHYIKIGANYWHRDIYYVLIEEA